MHTNCRLTSCFVKEHQSDYNGIIWFMVFELLVLCALNPLPTGGFPYRPSIVRNCVVWLMHFALLVERWCLIKGFHIAGPVCGVFICFNPHHKRTEALMSSFMFVQTSCWTNNGDASESKTHETQIMLLLYNLSFSNWWHHCPCVRCNHWSPVDCRCKGSTVVELWWSTVRRFHHWWIPHKSSAWCFLLCLP